MTAQFVAGKATRDALFLTSLHVTALPTMLLVTSAVSLLFVFGHAQLSRRTAPGVLVPVLFVISAALSVLEWMVRPNAPATVAVVVYLHISAAGPLLASGFWLIASERFDPRSARTGFGRIASAGTLGGLAGALMSAAVAALFGSPATLLMLAAIQVGAAMLIWRFAPPSGIRSPAEAVSSDDDRSGVRVVASAPHLRQLAAVVLLGTTSAALLDFIFKAQAVETFGPGDRLLHFFSLYYAATALLSFVLQTAGNRVVLEHYGPGLTTSTPSIALLAGTAASLLAPGFGSVLVARGGEAIMRGSWFRAGYELFFTPLPASEKRASKSIVDVALDRMGDATGGGLVRIVVLLAPAAQGSVVLALAMLTSIGAAVAASRLNRWYLRTLEGSLVRQGVGLDIDETRDGATTRVLLDLERRRADRRDARTTHATVTRLAIDPLMQDVLALRSGSREQALRVLSRDEGIAPPLVAHVIPLLESDELGDYALFALRKVAEEHVGQLADALLDPGESLAIRRRIARVFSVGVSQRATDVLVLALEDARFDVRFQAARSLAAIRDKNPGVVIDPGRIFSVIDGEVAVSRPVWEGRRLLGDAMAESLSTTLDEFVRDRAGQSLAHVFTLLSLVLPREPLLIAFRSLQSGDERLRGTALEYLDGVLPPQTRQRLWPFIVERPQAAHLVSGSRRMLADLLRAAGSVTLDGLVSREPGTSAGFPAL